ncbi:hypothetical protein OCGS_1615 [Oceaniovalibus guishaninsula JLT2003]|uniref:Uncharacterized protein n=1 Tax=Oceaniovalibus guishaninsula JLT2003 TaxID=1231392 RepID=K2HMN0_9RHOB|nr:hypothetical protein [Oceaniovalibus guishaninsula]EKE44099.1 hypothetical protein OCGS_1615 [Oceaniovalibus guishaninsula JLT2003]
MTPPVHAPRRTETLAPWRIGGMALRVWWIDVQGQAAPDALLVQARAYADAALPGAVAAEGHDHGLGFVVLHRGRAGTWLLLHWWAHGDVLCLHLALSEGGDFAPVAPRPLTACVWEMVPMIEERARWIDHMMREDPDPQGYLAA